MLVLFDTRRRTLKNTSTVARILHHYKSLCECCATFFFCMTTPASPCASTYGYNKLLVARMGWSIKGQRQVIMMHPLTCPLSPIDGNRSSLIPHVWETACNYLPKRQPRTSPPWGRKHALVKVLAIEPKDYLLEWLPTSCTPFQLLDQFSIVRPLPRNVGIAWLRVL